MGKSIPSASKLRDLARRLTFDKATASAAHKTQKSRSRVPPAAASSCGPHASNPMEKMEGMKRAPLGEVVSDCVRRWFKETLREARAGDAAMQVLVGQMYSSGYGVHRDVAKGRTWIAKASKYRSSVWKVSDKRPGYNASDSDSEELKGY